MKLVAPVIDPIAAKAHNEIMAAYIKENHARFPVGHEVHIYTPDELGSLQKQGYQLESIPLSGELGFLIAPLYQGQPEVRKWIVGTLTGGAGTVDYRASVVDPIKGKKVLTEKMGGVKVIQDGLCVGVGNSGAECLDFMEYHNKTPEIIVPHDGLDNVSAFMLRPYGNTADAGTARLVQTPFGYGTKIGTHIIHYGPNLTFLMGIALKEGTNADLDEGVADPSTMLTHNDKYMFVRDPDDSTTVGRIAGSAPVLEEIGQLQHVLNAVSIEDLLL